jgi:hypothetical protein
MVSPYDLLFCRWTSGVEGIEVGIGIGVEVISVTGRQPVNPRHIAVMIMKAILIPHFQ